MEEPSTPEYVDVAGAQTLRELLEAEGGCLCATELATELDVCESELIRGAMEHRLIAFQETSGRWVFAIWQFRGRKLIPGMEEVLKLLTHRPAWSHVTPFIFMLAPGETAL
ncbi:hypothetical protein ASA1KI_21600 [Opitutales bacterium ASA1]|uniref:hypothetical protein n=1 Tax=Congregicoccus parvus TaxID=3081749 RepID=UPI002B2DA97D|nr:hypothetical protein ASA1KI_21600 [Opitutales bacterium ASA1]